jgi:23S rRNA pseudouridine1911/1915/1917 synthase
VDKPPGLPSTGRDLGDPRSLQSMLTVQRGRMVWAAHQLDAQTSGVNLFVTRKSLVEPTSRRMRPPAGSKTYVAICHGEPEFAQRTIDLPIGWVDPEERRRLGIVSGGRPSRSRVRVLSRRSGFCALEVTLFTGRTHQARIHLAQVGHPLVGETRYRSPACDLHWRHALHAARVILGPPPAALRIEAPLPPDLVRLAARLRLSIPDLPAFDADAPV